MAKDMKTRKGKDNIYYPYTSPDIVIDSNGESQTTKNNNMKTDIDSIKTDLGTAQLTTTAKDVKGAVNEVAAQYKDIANKTITTDERTKLNSLENYDDTTIKNDLQTQKSRIDNLTTLPEGRTTGDAELIDGRVGADGITYDNIGGAIRGQVNSITENINDLASFKNKVIFTFEKNQSAGYIKNNGKIETEPSTDVMCIYTNDINCSPGDIFLYKGYGSALAMSYIFKKDNKIISSGKYNSKNEYTEITIPSGVNKVIFSSFDYTKDISKVVFDVKLKYTTLEEKINTIDKKLKYGCNGNVLYEKKYVACGDSFTEGDFTGYTDENGLSGQNSPVIYDKVRGMYKTYPWWIAERNNMVLVNEAKCGSDFTNVDGASNPFSVTRYQNVPKDADYITLMFGLNELKLTDEQFGKKTDTTNVTLWGAYNIVFEYFLTNMPCAKIGVIIADAWMTEKYANAVKEICTYWGIPVLDLKFDNNIPIGIDGRPGTSSKAMQLRNKVFKVTSSNGHPSVKAHEYRSTIIENFLRSL